MADPDYLEQLLRETRQELQELRARLDRIEVKEIGVVTDHGGLSGLSDDDHTQYALLAGRDANTLIIDQIRAYDSAGLKLTEDGGEGIFVEDATGDIGIGTTTPSTSGQTSGAPVVELESAAGPPEIKFNRSVTPNTGDSRIGTIVFVSEGEAVSEISCLTNNNDDSGELMFYTNPTGATYGQTLRLKIDSDGTVIVGNVQTNYGTLTINEDGVTGAPESLLGLRAFGGEASAFNFANAAGSDAADMVNDGSAGTYAYRVRCQINGGGTYYLHLYNA